MDPNTVLENMLALAKQIIKRDDADDDGTTQDPEAAELAAAVQDLDEWLRKGGFLPSRWAR